MSWSSQLNVAKIVTEAVLEIVCVAAPGYVLARKKILSPSGQRLLAELNMILFTPAMIFSKIASQLSWNQLADLAVIPFVFVIQTGVSYLVAIIVSFLFSLDPRSRKFVTAMAVFGNSNSLPISLVMSLSKTIPSLRWIRIKNDNPEDVSARGILYLLIFQQLGQFLRWTWGYHVLLAPDRGYDSTIQRDGLPSSPNSLQYCDLENSSSHAHLLSHDSDRIRDQANDSVSAVHGDSAVDSIDRITAGCADHPSLVATECSSSPQNASANVVSQNNSGVTIPPLTTHDHGNNQPCFFSRTRARSPNQDYHSSSSRNSSISPDSIVRKLQARLKKDRSTSDREQPGRVVHNRLARHSTLLSRVIAIVNSIMNPPLWAMLFALLVIFIPPLKKLLFDPSSFVANSITKSINQMGVVAVPLILVVLGSNLAINSNSDFSNSATSPLSHSIEDGVVEKTPNSTKLLIASILARMVLPTIFLSPILILLMKWASKTILDDPIFIVVCFLLTGAPSALQLVQICQINNVFPDVMSRVLLHGYVIWVYPSTLVVVMIALLVVEFCT